MLTVLHQHINDVFRSCSYQRASLQVIRWFLLMIIYAPIISMPRRNAENISATLPVLVPIAMLVASHYQ